MDEAVTSMIPGSAVAFGHDDGAVGIEVLDGPDRDTVVPALDGELTIGTGASNDVVLSDPGVSPEHLTLRSGAGVTVRDLGSRAGTFLGSVRIREATVPFGSCLRLGDTIIRLTGAGVEARVPDDCGEAGIPGLVGGSAALQEVARVARKLARSDVSVLVQGETGTGKEIVSRALHELGPRAPGPYVIVDLGALPATLIASHLLGHERGAFTGADSRHIGAFEQADGGSILLDEIGELPLSVQPALLGVLERRAFRRLGGKEEINVDVRVIAATHRDLLAQVAEGRFREDLYYRMAAARVHIPPLRERPEDVPPLVEHFARQVAGEAGVAVMAPLAGALRFHRWPGNVRELRNAVEGTLGTGNLSAEGLQAQLAMFDQPRIDNVVPYKEAREAALGAFERTYLKCLLESTGGNAAAAARLAHMDRSYLLTLLHRLRDREGPTGGGGLGRGSGLGSGGLTGGGG